MRTQHIFVWRIMKNISIFWFKKQQKNLSGTMISIQYKDRSANGTTFRQYKIGLHSGKLLYFKRNDT